MVTGEFVHHVDVILPFLRGRRRREPCGSRLMRLRSRPVPTKRRYPFFARRRRQSRWTAPNATPNTLIGHHVSGPPGKAGVPGALSRLSGNSRPDPCEDHACDFSILRSAVSRCLWPHPDALIASFLSFPPGPGRFGGCRIDERFQPQDSGIESSGRQDAHKVPAGERNLVRQADHAVKLRDQPDQRVYGNHRIRHYLDAPAVGSHFDWTTSRVVVGLPDRRRAQRGHDCASRE